MSELRVIDGAQRPIDQTRAIALEKNEERKTNNKLSKLDPKEQRRISRLEEKERLKEELSKNEELTFLKGEVYFEIDTSNIVAKVSSLNNSTKVGIYGKLRKTDTLQRIAKELYKDDKLWPIIAGANKITNPDSLHVGQILYVPDLITITANDIDTVTYVPINNYDLHEKIKKNPIMFNRVTLKNPTCTIGPVSQPKKVQKGDDNFPNSLGPYSGGDVGSFANTVLTQSCSLGKAKITFDRGKAFYKFAKGTLSMTKKVVLTPKQYSATFVRVGLKGFLVTSMVFGIYDGFVSAFNTNNLNYGLYTATKSTFNGVAATGIGVGAGVLLLEVCTPPGWVVLAVEVVVGGISLVILNKGEETIISDWEKKTFKTK